MAKAKPKPRSVVNSNVNVPMHSSIPREEDGAVRIDDLIEKLKDEFGDTLQWAVGAWVNAYTLLECLLPE